MYRLIAVVAVALVLSVSGALGLARPGDPVGPAPSSGVQAAAPVGAGEDDLAGLVGALQDRLRRLPADHAAWAALAVAHVEQARVTADTSWYDRAEQAVGRSLAISPEDNADGLAASAALAAARHDFDSALADAEAALAVSSHHPTALVVRVDALTELGRYADQMRALAVADRRQPGIPVASRYAYAQELRGDLPGAAATLRRSLRAATGSDRTYLLTLLADVELRLGRVDRAERRLREVVRDDPGDPAALAELARVAVARGDLDEAVETWRAVVAVQPSPEYLTELGELLEHQGLAEEAQAQYDVVLASTRLLGSGGVDTDLEAALFEADHGDPDRALTGARSAYAARATVHTADVLGWALHRSGRHREALPLAREATRLGSSEAAPWLHRGLVEAALGLDAAAARHLRRGLATDPGLSPWQAEHARRALAALAAPGDAR